MNIKRFAIPVSCILGLAISTAAVAVAADAKAEAALKHANELLEKNLLIDGHNDLPYVIRELGTPLRDVDAYDLNKTTPADTDIARLRQGHVGAQFWSVWVPSTDDIKKLGFARIQLEQIDIAHRVVERYPDDLQLALSVADIEEANRNGRIASLLGAEGGHGIENSLRALRTYYRLGVRYMTLTHFKTHDWSDSATDAPRHGGLTRFGQEVVKEMNRLGMLVDLSHVSAETMNDALDVTQAPVIFSHSSARALTPHPRNVPDEVLRRLPANGGVVMVTFISAFTVRGKEHDAWEKGFAEASGGSKLGDDNYDAEYAKYVAVHPEPHSTLADVADHVEHIRKVAGVDHVGLGSDFYGSKTDMAIGLEDTSRYPYLLAELVRRGWTDAELVKLARGNLLRASAAQRKPPPGCRRPSGRRLRRSRNSIKERTSRTCTSPSVDLPNPKSSRWGGGVTAGEMREMQWVRPELAAQIRFVEWTAEGRLRHAAFLGLRSDKSAGEVRREAGENTS